MQIFIALLSSIALKYDEGTLANSATSANIGALLVVLTILPLALGVILETPLEELCHEERRAELRETAIEMRQKMPSRAELREKAVEVRRKVSRRPTDHGAVSVEIGVDAAQARGAE